ncbi:hypothetical protein AB9F35_15120 [Rhizobium leguminosarum]|uniref:hypothetical protein n=1 Tax=Rhizobium leguminosarum TaxID=384 RepID=UPI003F9E649C
MTTEERVFTALLMQDGMMQAVTKCLVPIVQRIRSDGYTDGFKAGQESMRERAASLIAHPQCDFAEPQDAAEAIRDLSIEEPQTAYPA